MGTEKVNSARCWITWFKLVVVALRQIRGCNIEVKDESIRIKSPISRFQEKSLSFSLRRPYRKPTQVGRMRILRRLRELG